MKRETVERIISDALAIETESARDAGTLGYLARAMVQATMPHRKTTDLRHERQNGDYTLSMVAGNSKIGLPFGSVPRLLLAWIGAEALQTGERELVLGDSMSSFLAELGLNRTGGRWGDVTRLKDQSRRLFSTVITCSYSTAARDVFPEPFGIGTAQLWWQPQNPDQRSLFRSTLTLSDGFYREIVEHPVPVDMRVLKALRRSPLAIDIYGWSAYRLFTLQQSTKDRALIPWPALQAQFGSTYPIETGQGRRDFRKAFLHQLRKVQVFYPEARIEPTEDGLLLRESPLHLPSRPSVDNRRG